MNGEILLVIDAIHREKRIDKELLFEAVEGALATAGRKSFDLKGQIKVHIDRQTGRVEAVSERLVVEGEPEGDDQVSLAEARQHDPGIKPGEVLRVPVSPERFGRIAAQTAKQVIIQKIREAERELLYNEFRSRAGDILTGTVVRFEQGAVILDLGRTEGIIPHRERSPREDYYRGEQVRAYVLETVKSDAGPQIVLSRAHPGLVERLFELEVPEIAEGLVQIKAVAREAGDRTKLAVWSAEPNIDPVGACVGVRGERVKAIVRELRGEKIDIVRWHVEPELFITNALSPAKVLSVKCNHETKEAAVLVPDDQLSLAIGKKGQNVRLAAKLTGWHIDIDSPSGGKEARPGEGEGGEEAGDSGSLQARLESLVGGLCAIDGVDEDLARRLIEAGFTTPEQIAQAPVEDLALVAGLGEEGAQRLKESAAAGFADTPPEAGEDEGEGEGSEAEE